MPLEKEIAVYNDRLPQFNEHEGKYVLIHGDDVVDFFSAYDDAIKEGYQRFGLAPFLVKQVHAIEQIQFVSRFVNAAIVT